MTTGKLLSTKVGLEVERLLSGPLGGDVQIAAHVPTTVADVRAGRDPALDCLRGARATTRPA
ncbi:MAG: hypothetical protein ACR2NO_08165 [Chloroflexota bacterium]